MPPAVRQTNDSNVFSDIVLGYINRMFMAEDIDDRFEHYLEHPTMFAPLLTTSLSLSLSLSLSSGWVAPEHRLLATPVRGSPPGRPWPPAMSCLVF
jgi:hypothetical protein